MDPYQTILLLPYVIGLVLSLENRPSHPSNHIDIIKLEESFYIKNTKGDLFIINEKMNDYPNVIVSLNTIIYFEKYKLVPIEFYKILSRENALRKIDLELYNSLQLQFSVNKDYF
tara:strand:- start:238 stop:582 length:345 start_codon:yes stop_codon:yes gene_type:complete